MTQASSGQASDRPDGQALRADSRTLRLTHQRCRPPTLATSDQSGMACGAAHAPSDTQACPPPRRRGCPQPQVVESAMDDPHTMTVDHLALEHTASDQAGVLSRAPLAAAGVTRWNIRDQVRARRWRLIGRRAVVLDRGPPTARRREWIALLEFGQDAALCGLTASAAWGLCGFESDRVHLVVSRGARTHAFPWLQVHESRRYEAERDVHPRRVPRTVRPDRAVIDAAVWSSRPHLACAIVAAAVRQRITTAARLDIELRAAGRVGHRRLLLAVLADIDGGPKRLARSTSCDCEGPGGSRCRCNNSCEQTLADDGAIWTRYSCCRTR